MTVVPQRSGRRMARQWMLGVAGMTLQLQYKRRQPCRCFRGYSGCVTGNGADQPFFT
jgi:hypothetical protein